MDKRVFISPGKYVQGAGVLSQIGEEVAKIGSAPLVLSDSIVWDITGKTVEKSFEKTGTSYYYEEFSGESSNTEIERLAEVGNTQKL